MAFKPARSVRPLDPFHIPVDMLAGMASLQAERAEEAQVQLDDASIIASNIEHIPDVDGEAVGQITQSYFDRIGKISEGGLRNKSGAVRALVNQLQRDVIPFAQRKRALDSAEEQIEKAGYYGPEFERERNRLVRKLQPIQFGNVPINAQMPRFSGVPKNINLSEAIGDAIKDIPAERFDFMAETTTADELATKFGPEMAKRLEATIGKSTPGFVRNVNVQAVAPFVIEQVARTSLKGGENAAYLEHQADLAMDEDREGLEARRQAYVDNASLLIDSDESRTPEEKAREKARLNRMSTRAYAKEEVMGPFLKNAADNFSTVRFNTQYLADPFSRYAFNHNLRQSASTGAKKGAAPGLVQTGGRDQERFSEQNAHGVAQQLAELQEKAEAGDGGAEIERRRMAIAYKSAQTMWKEENEDRIRLLADELKDGTTGEDLANQAFEYAEQGFSDRVSTGLARKDEFTAKALDLANEFTDFLPTHAQTKDAIWGITDNKERTRISKMFSDGVFQARDFKVVETDDTDGDRFNFDDEKKKQDEFVSENIFSNATFTHVEYPGTAGRFAMHVQVDTATADEKKNGIRKNKTYVVEPDPEVAQSIAAQLGIPGLVASVQAQDNVPTHDFTIPNGRKEGYWRATPDGDSVQISKAENGVPLSVAQVIRLAGREEIKGERINGAPRAQAIKGLFGSLLRNLTWVNGKGDNPIPNLTVDELAQEYQRMVANSASENPERSRKIEELFSLPIGFRSRADALNALASI